MSFTQSLRRAAVDIEARLDVLVGQECGGRFPLRLREAMRYAVLGGGKRIRPFLVIETAKVFGVPPLASIDSACTLECIHCYSLVHDDLPSMDNDEVRRGRPTLWKAYDEWTSILAGDALLTLAFEILARPETHADPSVRAELVLLVARASGAAGMVGGQVVDLEADKLGVPAVPSLAHIRNLQAMKTGALIRVACEAGAALGRATTSERDALQRCRLDRFNRGRRREQIGWAQPANGDGCTDSRDDDAPAHQRPCWQDPGGQQNDKRCTDNVGGQHEERQLAAGM